MRNICTAIKDCQFDENKNIFIGAYHFRKRSEEAYFGINNPVKEKLVALFTRIHGKYEKHLVKEYKPQISDFVKSILIDISLIEKVVEDEFNVEKCQIGLLDSDNAFCIPMFWDKNAFGDTKKAKKHRISLNDIVETKKGFKYKNYKNKYLIIGFGIRLFNPKNKISYTPEETAAIFLHEVGHSFQHMLYGIQSNLVYTELTWLLIETYYNLKGSVIIRYLLSFNIFGLLFNFYDVMQAILNLDDIHEAKQKLQKDEGFKAGEEMFEEEDFKKNPFLDRQKLFKFLHPRDEQKTIIKRSLKKEKSQFWKNTAYGFHVLLMGILSPVLFLVDAPANIFLMIEKKIINKTHKWEEFADMFVTFYGLGPEITSSVSKLYRSGCNRSLDLGLLTFLNAVPLLNITIALWHYTEINNIVILNGYPEDKRRLATVYQGLRYELAHNKDLDSQTKQEIKEQMERTEKIYNEFVFGKGIKNIIYCIWNKIIRASIQKDADKTTVEANVLSVLQEKKEQIKNIHKNINH
jgi:hypothetical protein